MEQDDYYENRGGYRRHGGGYGNRYSRGERRNYQPRVEQPQIQYDPDAEMMAQLRLLLISVGDFHSRGPQSLPLSVNIKGLAAVLETDLEAHGPKVVGLVARCVRDLPVQAGCYAALAALLNARRPGFCRQLVERVAENLKADVAGSGGGGGGDLALVRARLGLGFLAELANCRAFRVTGPGGLADALLQPLAEVVADEGKCQAERDAAAALAAHAALRGLPALRRAGAAGWREGLGALLGVLQDWVNRRANVFGPEGLRPVFLAPEEDAPEGEPPCWDTVAAAVGALATCAQQVEEAGAGAAAYSQVLVQPWRDLRQELEDQEATAHTLPEGWALPAFPARRRNPARLALRLFDEGAGEHAAAMLAALPAHDRTILKSYLQDIAVTFHPTIQADGRRIGRIKTAADQMLACAKIIGRDVHMEYLIVEAVFELLLAAGEGGGGAGLGGGGGEGGGGGGGGAPYLHRVLLELLGAAPTIVPPAMAAGTELVFRRLPRCDFLAAKAFATWFAHNLANTGFAWPFWAHWAHVAQAPEDDAQRVWVAAVLETCVKLTYRERIAEAVPEEVHALLPPVPATYARYLDGTDDEAAAAGASGGARAAARRCLEMLRAREEDAAVRAFLMGDHHEGVSAAADGPGWRAAVFCQALLRAGEQTVAHARALLDRHAPTLEALAARPEHQVALVEATAEFWQASNQMFLFLMEELMLRDLVSPLIVVAWVFSDECLVGVAAAPFLWDVLSRAAAVSVDRVKLAAAAAAAAQRRRAEGGGEGGGGAGGGGDGGGDGDEGAEDAMEADAEEDPARAENGAAAAAGGTLEERLALLARRLREAQEVTQHLVARFVQVIGAYAAEAEDPAQLQQDPWFLAIGSYFRAVCRLYLQAPATSVEASEVLGQVLDPRAVASAFLGDGGGEDGDGADAAAAAAKPDPFSANVLAQLATARDVWA